MAQQAISHEVDITQTMLWQEPTEAYLKIMSPAEVMLTNNMRVVMRELRSIKQTQEQTLRIVAEIRKRMGEFGRGRSASTVSAEESEIITNDEDFFDEHSAALKPIYHEWITTQKKVPRQHKVNKMDSVRKDVQLFFYTFAPERLGVDDEGNPGSIAMDCQAAGETKQLNTYLKLGKAYKGKLDQTNKGKKRGHSEMEAAAASGVGGAVVEEQPSSQGSDRALRAQRRQEKAQG